MPRTLSLVEILRYVNQIIDNNGEGIIWIGKSRQLISKIPTHKGIYYELKVTYGDGEEKVIFHSFNKEILKRMVTYHVLDKRNRSGVKSFIISTKNYEKYEPEGEDNLFFIDN